MGVRYPFVSVPRSWRSAFIGVEVGVLLLAGTTASGKSSLALHLAQKFGAAIVSADAMTVYRGLDIGTAKPTEEERSLVPHYGIDVRNLDQEFDVSAFVETVDKAMCAHKHIVIAGGTTFWISALVRPLAVLPPGDPSVRQRLEALQNPHAELVKIDPETALRLHPNDRVRVIRALEVHQLTGKTQTQLHAAGPRRAPLDAQTVFLDHPSSPVRIDQRLQKMIHAGYVEEVQSVLDAGWSPDLKPLKSFAYRHLVEHCLGGLTLDEAIRRTSRDTRHYAKKQRTWARNLGWGTSDDDHAINCAKRAFQEH